MPTVVFLAISDDGRVYGQSTNYNTARNTCTGHLVGEAAASLGQHKNVTVYTINRVILKFDTTELPAAAIIDQVNITLTSSSPDSSNQDFNVEILKYDWSAYDPVGAGNRETVYDGILAADADDSIWRNSSGMSLDTPYTSGNLDTDWPVRGGYTYYAMRSDEDKAASAPTDYERIQINCAEYGTAAYRPKLTIIYHLLETDSEAGGFTPTGTIAKETSTLKSGSTTPTGKLINKILKSSAGSITLAGALDRAAQKLLVGSTTPTGALNKYTTKFLVGALTLTGDILAVTHKTQVGALSYIGTLIRTISKQVSDTFTTAGNLIRETGKPLSGALTPAGFLVASANKSITGSWTATGTVIRKVLYNLTGNLTFVGILTVPATVATPIAIRHATLRQRIRRG